MKRLTILVLLLISDRALAIDNSAQAWEFRKNSCGTVAKVAAMSRMRKEKGMEPQSIPDKMREIDPLYPLFVWAVDYGNTGATSAEDAAEKAAAKCLDNIDDIYRDWNAGMKRDPKDYR